MDNKRTLMNYLADWCAAHAPDLLSVADELPTAGGEASRHPLAAWAATFKSTQGKVKLVRQELDAAAAQAAPLPGAHLPNPPPPPPDDSLPSLAMMP